VIEKAALIEAEAEALAMIGVNEDLGAVLVTVSETWHPGVVGLVASRLKERFQRPAFAITFERGRLGTGSGRSITGVDLGKTVREAVALGLLTKGGGHAMAAGLTIEKANLGSFRAFMDAQCAAAIKTAQTEKSLLIDGAMTARAATPHFVASFEEAGPFGTGNPEPVFAFPHHTLVFADIVGENHLRCRFKANDGAELNAIAFRVVGSPLGDFLMKQRGQSIHVVGTLSTDSWQGRERVQLRIIDAARG
jgi:single-stranded-DNA-specific exonuclease